MATQIPFTVRLSEVDHATLDDVAKLHGKKLAVLASEIIVAGLDEYIDPEKIEQAFNEKRDKMLAAAAQLRAKRGKS